MKINEVELTIRIADRAFAAALPKLYDTYLAPMIFASCAADMANRLRPRPLANLLEIDTGTGAVTRA